ncbi:GNAT family N-acetyltransferase [Paractinoplanes atraurantiacus]|nr:GNAT family N-acetyltransferase [Actinoplanes atraurantiacus]
MTEHDLEPQLAANRRYWTGWAGPDGAGDPGGDLPIYRTDIAYPLLNGVLRVRNQPLDQAFDTAKQRLAGSAWAWWVGADSDEGTAEGLLALGSTQIADLPIMAIDITRLPGFEPPAGLQTRPVAGRAEITEYVGTYAGPLGIEGDLGLVVDRELDFAYSDVVRLAAFVDDRIVGTCTLSLGTEVAALYCIATDPAFRRRGIATELTLVALRVARAAGHRIATLQSTPEGEPVYRRIGFETVSRYRVFAF